MRKTTQEGALSQAGKS